MARIITFFDGATSAITPTIGNISASNLVEYASDAAYEADNVGAPSTGNVYYNTANNTVKYYDGSAWIVVGRALDIQANANDISDLRSVTGTVDGSTSMGTYTGTILNDNESTKQNLQQLETYAQNLQNDKQNISEKAQPNGYASLDGTGKVPSAQLPSYVDDVVEYADLASFPVSGETGKIYLAQDTNKTYRWTGSVYVEVSAGIDWASPVNADIIPDTDNTHDLGSTTKQWNQIYTNEIGSVGNLGINAPGGNVNINSVNSINLTSTSQLVEVYGAGGGLAPAIKLRDGLNSEAVILKSPDVLTSDWTMTLPTNSGSSNQVLTTDGSGNTSWSTPSIVMGDLTTHEADTSTHGVTTVAGLSETQTFTNKTFDDELTMKEIAAPSSPSSGYQKLYFDTSDNKLKRKNSSGDVIAVGSGVGGGLNLESDPYAQAGIGSWTTYDDGASSSMVDGTGGSPGVTFAVDANETQILSGDYKGTYKITFDAVDRQGEGVAKVYTVPQAFRDKGYVYVSGRYSADVALSTGDFGFYAYDVTNPGLLNVNGLTTNNLVGIAADKVGYFTAVIYIASTTASLRLGFHRKVTTATATVFHFSDLKISDSPIVDSPIMNYMGTYTPSTFTGLGTPTSVYFDYWRNDDRIRIQFRFTTGTVTGSNAAVGLPSGLTINSSGNTIIGAAWAQGATDKDVLCVGGDTSSTFGFINSNSAGAALTGTNLGTGQIIDGWIECQITEWANQTAKLSTTEMMNTTVKARYYATSTGAIPDTTTIFNFSSSSYDSHSAVTTGASWKFTAPKTGYYRVSVTIPITTGAAASRYDTILNKGGTTTIAVAYTTWTEAWAGIATSYLNTSLYLTKGEYIALYHNETVNGGTYTQTQIIEIEEIPDFSVYSVYGITEYIESKADSQTYSITGGTTGDLTSISLSPGTYDLYAQYSLYNNGAVTAGLANIGISTTSGNSNTGLTPGHTMMSNSNPGTSAYPVPFSVDYKNVTVTSTTTYYLKASYSSAITNLLVSYKISARKVK